MFLDLGIGILISVLISKIVTVPLTSKLIAAGALFSLAPDLDVFVELVKRGRIGGRVQGHHRELTHFPLTYLPFVFIVYYFAGAFYACLFGLAVLAHFLHDSVGMGWGIKWLWPFSSRSYKFFSEKDGSFSGNLVVSWRPQELKEVIAAYGDNHWFRNYYLRVHPIAVIELAVFVVSLLVLYYFIS